MKRVGWWRIGAVVFLTTTVTGVFAQTASSSFEERLSRVERLLDSNALIDLVDRVARMQREIQGLRGELEEQNHALSQLKQQQRDLYLDLDRRLSKGVPGNAGQVPVGSSQGSGTTSAGGTAAPSDGQVALATAPPVSAAPIDPAKEEAAYQNAFNLLKAGRYDQATVAFRDFLRDYQGGSLADNAQYWLGEAYYVTRQFEPALKEFQVLVQQYPDSQKLTHAMLKIGYIYDELGKTAEAEATLQTLADRYPHTTAARLARERLQKLRAGTS